MGHIFASIKAFFNFTGRNSFWCSVTGYTRYLNNCRTGRSDLENEHENVSTQVWRIATNQMVDSSDLHQRTPSPFPEQSAPPSIKEPSSSPSKPIRKRPPFSPPLCASAILFSATHIVITFSLRTPWYLRALHVFGCSTSVLNHGFDHFFYRRYLQVLDRAGIVACFVINVYICFFILPQPVGGALITFDLLGVVCFFLAKFTINKTKIPATGDAFHVLAHGIATIGHVGSSVLFQSMLS